MGCIQTHTERRGGTLVVQSGRIGGGLSVGTSRQGGNLHVRTSLICTLNLEEPYLRVEPEYIWLTESNNWQALVKVESNRAWRID